MVKLLTSRTVEQLPGQESEALQYRMKVKVEV